MPKTKSKRANVELFRGIETLFTLEGAAAKEGRRITPEDLSPVSRAAILVKDGRIIAIGPEKLILKNPLLKTARVRETKLANATVIPAFVECHTHLIYGGNRAREFEMRNQGVSYQEIAKAGGGILATVIPTREASLQKLTQIGQTRADRYIRQGVTTVEAKSGYGLNLEAEFKILKACAKITGARIVPTFLGAHAVPKDYKDAAAYVDFLVNEAFPKLKKNKLAKRVDIFVEKGYFEREVAHRYLNAAKEHGFDLVIHADQMTLSGGSDLAVEFGARSADHLVQIKEKEIHALAKSEVTAVLLPNADLYMNCAYPPARKLIDAGARVAVATDLNPGTAPSQDLGLAGVLARIQMKMSLSEVVGAYTIGAAYALGLGSDLGALTPGRFADFTVLDGGFDDLFIEVGRMPIESVYREGRKLL